ncbi:uncharacterized protein LOC114536684 [Dendronephthya gigantea]|uniref:uncharacterized protein LOC114536684 n=1 Tax=Dendronephthya gigantea TaxID=151771 RepID=UPI00106B961A|nr:uncharacterized protein LOC114536684 [Dendronephthya gigantea]
MICHLCGNNKLSKEFPHEHLTEECTEHPLLHCLRCLTASVRVHHRCSQCDAQVNEDNKHYRKYVETLESLFPAVATNDEAIETLDSTYDDSESRIVITTLSGDSTTLPFDPDQTILSLKKDIEKELKTPSNKQSLLYNEIELKPRGETNEILTLEDYNVQPNSRIYLLVLLYAVPDGFDHVIFDLFWGYPHRGRDYLDASVFLYSGAKFIEVVDYSHTESKSCLAAVRHSGDVMDDAQQLGHHTINVSIKSIPAHINKLVFTLSAWNSPNISKYPNPSLKFFDAKFPKKQLCSDEMSGAAHAQAIVMCCLTKRESGWQVFSLKKLSAGNAKKYDPLKNTIGSLIRKGCV